MKCPFCNQPTRIYNSRSSKTIHQTWRRHQCIACKKTFTTREKIDWSKSTDVETSSGKHSYSYAILLSSIIQATATTRIPLEVAIDLCSTVENQIIIEGFFINSVQKSSIIRDTCIDVLSRYDKLLAIHYCNVVYDGKPPQSILRAILG